MNNLYQIPSPEAMFELGNDLAQHLRAGDLVLLQGGLGAGKTLLTKGIMGGLGFDVDEVTSPSFSLVNLYVTETNKVYHIDLWRLDSAHDPGGAVGLEEILEEDCIVIIEWAERLSVPVFSKRTIRINISGDGDAVRTVSVQTDSDE